MTGVRVLPSAHSAAFLPAGSALLRRPRAPNRVRPGEFLQTFETRALVYDAFWHADGARVLLVGPPPMNLWPQIRAAHYLALPSKTPLRARYHRSLSTMITELLAVPADTSEVVMSLAGHEFALLVQPSSANDLAGRNALFTMSKDNDLAWIREWAHYHAAVHRADAIVFFDNGSTAYAPAEIESTLLGVAGIDKVAVLSLPYAYGATDMAVLNNPYYTLFLQVSAMTVALRRYAPRAAGLLNCDVDELVATPKGTNIFDLVGASPKGLVVMKGQWVEPLADHPVGQPATHRDFHFRLRDAAQRVSRPKKWALAPTRRWLDSLDVYPYMHWIAGRPLFAKAMPESTFYWHFKGINTRWKDKRAELSPSRDAIERDDRLGDAMAVLTTPKAIA
ncbi:MAG TPA: hypothetical protein VGO70_03860 [Arsenicitalea sp.]|nr:hypothetical protein [Arsenicitalea sp.]